VKLWIATFVNDEVADEFGSKVFYDEESAKAFVEEYEGEDDSRTYATYMEVKIPDAQCKDLRCSLHRG
jgi:hypothetical protein